MCGICGIASRSRPIEPETIRKMADTLRHRGPDQDGYYCGPGIALGHRRLSIIDLASGRQPIANENGTIHIVFNGEIYNYDEIRRELIGKGHRFSTRSDTETILHLYEEEGAGCVQRLRGMFAFAIYDQRDRSLFLARDRIGKKPLYYAHTGADFVFGSEIKSLLSSGLVSRDIDLQALSDYLSFSYIPSPKSIFRAIRKLPPGHYLVYKNGSVRTTQYWDLQFNPEPLSMETASERLREVLDEAVRIRLISEVPLGAFLSGGIDSSLIVGTMATIHRQPVRTCTVGFDESGFDEIPYARATSALFGTDHHELRVNVEDDDILDTLAWHFDEPFADSSALPTYYVCKAARQRVTVALSGDGGDENFAGYRRYRFDVLENRLRAAIPGILRRSLIAGVARIYPKADRLPQLFRAKTLLTNLTCSPLRGYFNTMSRFSSPFKRTVLHPDIRTQLQDYDSFSVFEEYANQTAGLDPLSAIQYLDFKTYLPDGILVKVDRASMANSLEVRCPLLDHHMVELAARIPPDLKLFRGTGKRVLKAAARTLLTQEIMERKKMGFCIPVDQWTRGKLRKIIEEQVLSTGAHCASYFSHSTLRTMWREHCCGVKNYGAHFWSLIMFEKWARTHRISTVKRL